MNNILWAKLPYDIMDIILKYDGRITKRNGMYMNKLPHPDVNYPLILERMCEQRYRRFLSTCSFVTIDVPGAYKQICYWATNNGVTITVYSFTDTYNMLHEERIFTNNNKINQ